MDRVKQQGKIVAGAISGTSVMTFASYVLSWISKNNFKEPEILSKLIRRLFGISKITHARIAGWFLHYLVGLLFAELYAPVWEKTPVKANFKSGLVLGGICGFAAILVWKFTLAIHPDPPRVKFIPFALQLFAVHLLFGAFTAIGYNIDEIFYPA